MILKRICKKQVDTSHGFGVMLAKPKKFNFFPHENAATKRMLYFHGFSR
jgi:hypothetical protein